MFIAKLVLIIVGLVVVGKFVYPKVKALVDWIKSLIKK